MGWYLERARELFPDAKLREAGQNLSALRQQILSRSKI